MSRSLSSTRSRNTSVRPATTSPSASTSSAARTGRRTRSRVRSAVKDMAKELTELYSRRLKIEGHAFSPDTDMQSDFERRFEFDETSDQLRCIDEIKGDMERSCPMDRLLCGDVGFGKTEVALRARVQVRCGRQAVRHP